MSKTLNVFRVSTTGYEEEDFFLHTELDEDEIVEVVTPIVMAEREGYQVYDNESILNALEKKYPRKIIELIVEFNTITI
jgi:hypothetical protein